MIEQTGLRLLYQWRTIRCWQCSRHSRALHARALPRPHTATRHSQPPPLRVEEQRENEDDIAQSTEALAHRLVHRLQRPRIAHPAQHAELVRIGRIEGVDAALRHFQTFEKTATVVSWHFVFSLMIAEKRLEETNTLWRRWQSFLPKSGAKVEPHSVDHLPTCDTYGLLIRAGVASVTAEIALKELNARGQPSNVFLHNSLIKNRIIANDYVGARALLRDMRLRQIRIDLFTVGLRISMIKKRAQSPQHRAHVVAMTSELWDEMMSQSLRPSMSHLFYFSSQFRASCDIKRCAELVDCYISYDLAPRSLHVVHECMTCSLRRDRIDVILKLYHHLRTHNCQPDGSLFGIMITAFHRAHDTQAMALLYSEMIALGQSPGLKVFNVLLKSHATNGSIEQIDRLFRDMAAFKVRADATTFNAIQQGICNWYYEILDAKRKKGKKQKQDGIHSARCAKDESASERDEQQREIERQLKAGDEEAHSGTSSHSDTNIELLASMHLQPLASYLLPWMTVMSDRGVLPTPHIYHRLLLALRADNDNYSILYFLNEMVDNGLELHMVAFGHLLAEFAVPQEVDVYRRMGATQLFVLCDKVHARGVPFNRQTYLSLLEIAINTEKLDDILSLYSRMIASDTIYPSHSEQLYLKLMKFLFNNSNETEMALFDNYSESDRQHERMNLIIQCYDDMNEQGLAVSIQHYDCALAAYAILGNSDGMKGILRTMRLREIEPERSTITVLHQAREHVAYTAEIYNEILEQQTQLQTREMEQRHPRGLVRERKHISQSQRLNATGADQLIDPLAHDTQSLASTLFALPDWSPLQKHVERAAVQLKHSILPIYHASCFPALQNTLETRLVPAARPGPTKQERELIRKQLKLVRLNWPVPPKEGEGFVEEESVDDNEEQTESSGQTGALAAFAAINTVNGVPVDAKSTATLTGVGSLSSFSTSSTPSAASMDDDAANIPTPAKSVCPDNAEGIEEEAPLSVTGAGSVTRRLNAGGFIGKLLRPFNVRVIHEQQLKRKQMQAQSSRANSASIADTSTNPLVSPPCPLVPLPKTNASNGAVELAQVNCRQEKSQRSFGGVAVNGVTTKVMVKQRVPT